MSDAELKDAMRAIARVAGLTLSDARIDGDLAAFKRQLAAIDHIERVELPMEAEPSSRVILRRQP